MYYHISHIFSAWEIILHNDNINLMINEAGFNEAVSQNTNSQLGTYGTYGGAMVPG